MCRLSAQSLRNLFFSLYETPRYLAVIPVSLRLVPRSVSAKRRCPVAGLDGALQMRPAIDSAAPNFLLPLAKLGFLSSPCNIAAGSPHVFGLDLYPVCSLIFCPWTGVVVVLRILVVLRLILHRHLRSAALVTLSRFFYKSQTYPYPRPFYPVHMFLLLFML
jgi:hypothetical protein